MVDRYVVQARLAKIREYVALLRRVRWLADERRFVADPLIYGNAERYLQDDLRDFEGFVRAVSKLL